MFWVAFYSQKGKDKMYRFGASNYFTASIRFWAWAAFQGGDIALRSIVEDTINSFTEN